MVFKMSWQCGRRSKWHVTWEQLLIVAVTGTVLLMGIRWGLPNEDTTGLLVYGTSLTVDQREQLTQLRDESRSGLQQPRDSSIERTISGGKNQVRQYAGEALPDTYSERHAIFDLKRFVVASSAVDEDYTFSILSDMEPSRLNFDPRGRFTYGGTYLYPLGFALFALKRLGIIEVSRDIAFYFDHPVHITRMYVTGRMFNVLAFLGILVLLAKLGNDIGGRLCGTCSELAFALSTMPLNMSIVSKPHVYAAFWALLSVYLAVLYCQVGKRRYWLLAAGAAGWAAGASFPCWSLVIVFIVLFWNTDKFRSFIKITVGAAAVMLLVFLIANPYVILDYRGFGFALAKHWSFQRIDLSGWLADLLIRSYSFPLGFVALLGLALAGKGGTGLVKRLAVLGTSLILVAWSPLSTPPLNPRAAVFVGTLLCLFAGYGLARIREMTDRFWKGLWPMIMLISFLPGICFFVFFARDTILDSCWYKPTRAWLQSAGIGKMTKVGLFARPTPLHCPPFPFVNATIVNMNSVQEEPDRPDYVIIRCPHIRTLDLDTWESHFLRSEYTLAHDLGSRRSYEWFLGFRIPNISQKAAWVFKPARAEKIRCSDPRMR